MLYLVRHGETDWNKLKRFQSRSEVPLNARGEAQAALIRDELRRRGVEFLHAYCSPMGRAQRTAEIILAGTPTPLTVEPGLIELEFGGFEGRLESELRAELGAEYDRWRDSHYTLTPPYGGEDILSGAERVRPALERLRPQALVQDVLAVAHQAVFMALKVAITGRTDVASAQSFKQNNDEVEAWDLARGECYLRFQVHVPED
jgi:phosphoserine phosphatase